MINKLRQTIFRQRVRFLFIGLAISGTLSYAYGPEWTSIGAPQYEFPAALLWNASPAVVLVGTGSDPGIPESGGLYAKAVGDTAWQYLAFQGKTVHRLQVIPELSSPNLFATAYSGLYVSADAQSWDSVTAIGTWDSYQVDFAVSRLDTSLWAVATSRLGVGGVYVSHDRGHAWNELYYGYVTGNLLFSSTDTSLLYFSESSWFNSISLNDTLVSNIYYFEGSGIRGICRDALEQVVYAVSAMHVARHDAESGETEVTELVAGAGVILSAQPNPTGGIIVGTSRGLFAVSRDFEWSALTDTSDVINWRIFASSDTGCIAGSWDEIFIADLPATASPREKPDLRGDPLISVHPNPAQDVLTIEARLPGRLLVYDVLGRLVAEGVLPHAVAQVTMDIGHLSSGTYYYYLQSPTTTQKARLTGNISVVR